MDFLSDFGGFNDGILIIPTVFFAFYSERVYQNDVYTQMPVKKKRKQRVNNQLQNKLAAENPYGSQITA